MMITVIVSLIVSSRVGQVTFFSSATTSDTKLAGNVFGSVGTLGLSIRTIIKDDPPSFKFVFRHWRTIRMFTSADCGVVITRKTRKLTPTKSPLPGDNGYSTKNTRVL